MQTGPLAVDATEQMNPSNDPAAWLRDNPGAPRWLREMVESLRGRRIILDLRPLTRWRGQDMSDEPASAEILQTKKYGTVTYVPQELWESGGHVHRVMETQARRQITNEGGEIVGEIETRVEYEKPHDRDLFPELYPEGTPPMAAVHFAAMVIPRTPVSERKT